MDHLTPGTNDSLPILLVIDPDEDARRLVTSTLVRRYGLDYRVLSLDSGAKGIEALRGLAGGGADVALMAVELHLPDMSGLAFLEQAQGIYKDAARALLMPMDERGTRIPFDVLPVLRQAFALGRIHFYILKGWANPEESVFPQVQDALSRWARTHQTHHEVVRVVGERQSRASHVLRDALTTNTIPFGFYAIDTGEGRRLSEAHSIDQDRLPAVILHNGSVIHQPTLEDVAQAHGMRTHPDATLYDLAIIGAGPAGLAASVYSSSEGLRTLVVESQSIGGQAGTSSMIRNYLGFPRGVSGGELTFRAWEQTLLFGTEFVFTQRVAGLRQEEGHISLLLDQNDKVLSKAVVIASGVSYRRLNIPALERLIGVGVFYGAAGAEAPAMTGQDVYVIGGANSAGQAALHLANFARQVTLLVRGESLATGMSDYLVRQIDAAPNIAVRLRCEVVDGWGDTHLETLALQDRPSGRREQVSAAALFVMIGAEPRTDWLRGVVEMDERGFILTDRDVPNHRWPLSRMPLPFETSMPGVFAVGDVRHGSVKRVAGAAGEGAVAIGSVHQFLGSTV